MGNDLTSPLYWADAIERDILEPDKITIHLGHLRQALRRAPDADAAALRELVRELAALVRWYREGKPIEGVPKYLHGAKADKALARADAFLRGSGAEVARKELLGALAVASLLKAAGHALRSYQYGNGSTELAKNIADKIDAAFADVPPAPSREKGARDG